MANTKRAPADRVIRWASTVSVIVLAGIAAVISYKHMYQLVLRYGETSWTAALLPVSVDGMIVVASMSLLVDSRQGRRSGVLPWTLLVLGSAASLAANVAVAEPSLVGRLIAAWPSCALIGAYELLMRQVRHTAVKKAGPIHAGSDAVAEAAHRTSPAARRACEDSGMPLRLAVAPTLWVDPGGSIVDAFLQRPVTAEVFCIDLLRTVDPGMNPTYCSSTAPPIS
jgi:hypothetical protein